MNISEHKQQSISASHERSLVHLLTQNINLKNQARALYTALGLDYEGTSHEDAVAVCEALRGLLDDTVGGEG